MRQMKIFRIYIVILLTLASNISFGQEQKKISEAFKAEIVIEGVSLKWNTEQKMSVNYFEVQKSNDGKRFKTIGIVLAPEDNQDESAKFRIDDKQITTNKKVFYRLKYVDPIGKASFSEMKKLSSH